MQGFTPHWNVLGEPPTCFQAAYKRNWASKQNKKKLVKPLEMVREFIGTISLRMILHFKFLKFRLLSGLHATLNKLN